MDIYSLYRPLQAVSSSDFNTCFYCGCVATQLDLAPPLNRAEFYLKTREQADFYSIPACNECYKLLKSCRHASLNERVDALKLKLAKKYETAIRIYEHWQDDEIEALDYSLRHSVEAGLKVGEESYQRYKFTGFEYEVDGEKHNAYNVDTELYSVFGEEFSHFRDALTHASRAFAIPKAKLIDLYAEHGNQFDQAIQFYHAEMEKKLFAKELKRLCSEFAKNHKQNSKFVMHTVELYIKNDDSLTIKLALNKLYNERVKTWNKTPSQALYLKTA